MSEPLAEEAYVGIKDGVSHAANGIYLAST